MKILFLKKIYNRHADKSRSLRINRKLQQVNKHVWNRHECERVNHPKEAIIKDIANLLNT